MATFNLSKWLRECRIGEITAKHFTYTDMTVKDESYHKNKANIATTALIAKAVKQVNDGRKFRTTTTIAVLGDEVVISCLIKRVG